MIVYLLKRILFILVFSFCTCLFSPVFAQNDDQSLFDNKSIIQPEEILPEETEEIERSAVSQRYYEQIESVLGREEFGKTEFKKAWRKIDTDDKESRNDKFPEWLIKFFEWLERNSESEKKDISDFSLLGLAKFIEVVFWVLAIGFVAFIIFKYHKQIGAYASLLKGHKRQTESLPTTMFGLDIKKESLPDDIVGTAKIFWSNGDQRQAIAILLRASLVRLVNEHNCRFYDSDTEAECCLRIDQQAPESLSEFMRSLVAVWQKTAYAHRLPVQDKFDSLCTQWQKVFP